MTAVLMLVVLFAACSLSILLAERTRCAVSAAPAVVLGDEPTGNLDSKSSDETVNLLKRSNKEYKQTIIMITHNIEIAKIADRIIRIEDGKIV